jgi:hypothetical protein
MIRGTTRTLLLSSVALLGSTGCDALTVRSFSGAVLQMTLSATKPTPAGQHFELWARDANDDIIRLQPFYDLTNYKTAPGFMIRQAISLTSPCMTDDKGNLLTDAAAYPATTNFGGVTQTPAQQAQQRIDRINQLAPPGAAPLLGVLPWDPTPEPTIPADTAPANRKAICDDYRSKGPNTYVPNPDQISTPLHGAVYGFMRFVTVTPPTNYDGIRFDVPLHLDGVKEFFITVEGATVDPLNRGPLYVTSQLVPGGRDVLQFTLSPATDGNGAPSGALAVYTNLDQDPVQF